MQDQIDPMFINHAADVLGDTESTAIRVGLAEKAKEFTASGGEVFLLDVTEMLLKNTLAC